MKKILLTSILFTICLQVHSQWQLTGNSGTSASTNFIGTIDNVAFKIRTKNVVRVTVTTQGKVGIGLSSPVFKLDVKGGSINTDSVYRMSGSQVLMAKGSGNFFAGINSGYFVDPSLGGVSNTALGNYSLYSNTWGQDNTAIGENSLYSNNGAHNNTAVGAGTMYSNTSGSLNTAIGAYAMNQSNSGYQNVAVGAMSLLNNAGGGNVALGYDAMYNNTKGGDNVSIGFQSMYYNSTAGNNVAIGRNALLNQSYSNGNVYYLTGNVAVGNDALYNNQPTSNVTGVSNTAIGTASLYNNSFGFENTASGYNALYGNTGGVFNTGIGSGALYNNASATRNTAVGKSAGAGYNNGNYNTFIGSYCDANAASYLNSSAIGDFAQITASGQARIGDGGVTSIGGYAGWTTLPSDGRFKKNVLENVPGMEFINKLRPVTYTVDVHGVNSYLGVNETGKENIYDAKEKIRYTGFIAQEVERAAKETGFDFSGVDAPKNDKDVYGIRYAEFVVPLVKAFQELDKENAELRMQNTELTKRIEALEHANAALPEKRDMQPGGNAPGIVLEQNQPNPFNNKTVIRYSVASSFNSAIIVISDGIGKSVKTCALAQPGKGEIIISSADLAKGVYNYSLIIDGKVMAVKQLVVE